MERSLNIKYSMMDCWRPNPVLFLVEEQFGEISVGCGREFQQYGKMEIGSGRRIKFWKTDDSHAAPV